MNNSIDIETYTDACKNEVGDLIVRIQKDEFGIPISLDRQPDLLHIPDFYQVHNGNFWVAKSGNTFIGTIALLDIGNKRGALRKMFVAKRYRGKDHGVGLALLTTLISWARDKGMTELFLGTTEKFVAAQRFYEKNGFTIIHKQDLPESFPVMDVDVKFYSLSIC